jgi:FlaA1/EpsC-like NDP-sugar epimerase
MEIDSRSRLQASHRARLRIVGIAALHGGVWLAALAVAARLVGVHGLGQAQVMALALLVLAVKTATAWWLGSFAELWLHTSLEDLIALLESAVLTSLPLAAVLAMAPALGAPPQLAFVDAAMAVLVLAPLRVAPRIARELLWPALTRRRRRVVLAGRAEAIDLDLRRRNRQPGPGERVVGLVLEGEDMSGSLLRRVPVLDQAELERQLERRAVSEVLLVPPASPAFVGALERLCRRERTQFRQAASLTALGELLRAPEQLLERAPATVDQESIRAAVGGKRVLVTGAGGSIGSELVRQLLSLGPRALICVDRSENALFNIERELAARAGEVALSFHIVDARDAAAVQRLFASQRPEIVFHAAAHKHVPMMERHPCEAVLNNVIGTRTIADAAEGSGVEAFIFISTDKAVNPCSVMGATKRLGELYVRARAGRSRTRFAAVRFGNVLGSSGSVLLIFIEQIQRGGPVTVTHPEMRRFFMLIPEACRLVLAASAFARGGELFVLDMGEPVRVLDLAHRVIERAGLRPGVDIPIIFSGARPGEKLVEELIYPDEERAPCAQAGMHAVAIDAVEPSWLNAAIDVLAEAAEAGNQREVLRLLGELVPDFAQGRRHEDEEQRREADVKAFM